MLPTFDPKAAKANQEGVQNRAQRHARGYCSTLQNMQYLRNKIHIGTLWARYGKTLCFEALSGHLTPMVFMTSEQHQNGPPNGRIFFTEEPSHAPHFSERCPRGPEPTPEPKKDTQFVAHGAQIMPHSISIQISRLQNGELVASNLRD